MQWLLLSKHSAQVSPGTTRFFLSIHLPHLSPVIPCSYWASACYAVLPSRKTLYVISVRQTGDLPVVSLFPHPASFRFLSRGHPCLRLYPSHCRADSGLSPVRNVRRQAHIKKPSAVSDELQMAFLIYLTTDGLPNILFPYSERAVNKIMPNTAQEITSPIPTETIIRGIGRFIPYA